MAVRVKRKMTALHLAFVLVCCCIKATVQTEAMASVEAEITGVRIAEAKRGVVTLSAGRTAQLTCATSGNPNPPPTYQWTFNNMGSNKTYKVNTYALNTDKSLNGHNLSCIATNCHGNGTTLSSGRASVLVNVLYMEAPKVAGRHITVNETENATLRCSAEGNPQPRFKWLRSWSSEVVATSADFSMENVQRSAAGEYVCRVSNSEGTRETTVNLIVIGVGVETAVEEPGPGLSSTEIGLLVGGIVLGLLLAGTFVAVLLRTRSKACWSNKMDEKDIVGGGPGDIPLPDYQLSAGNSVSIHYENTSPEAHGLGREANTYDRLGGVTEEEPVYENLTSETDPKVYYNSSPIARRANGVCPYEEPTCDRSTKASDTPIVQSHPEAVYEGVSRPQSGYEEMSPHLP